MIVGLVLAGVGLIWVLAPNLPRLGRLPGNIVIERENSRFYFPIVTCIVISAVPSLIMWLIREENKAMSKKKPKQTWGWAPKKTASSIALVRLMKLLFEFLTSERKLDPRQTAAAMWRDYQRGGRHDKPAFLKDLLPPDGLPASSRRIRTGVPKRQARHLA